MSLFHILHAGAGANAVQLLPTDTRQVNNYSPCYAGIRLDSDGNIYTRLGQGNWSNAGQWLLFGTNSSFNVTRTIDNGSLTTDAGEGPLALSTDRTYDISNSAWETTKTTIITLKLDAGAGTVAERQYTLKASLFGVTKFEDVRNKYYPTWKY